MSRGNRGVRRPPSRWGRRSDRGSICPAVCQQPPPRRMGEQREGAVLGPLRESRVPGPPPCPLTLSVSPRVRRAALETLGRRWAQLPLCVCLSIFVSVFVSVWLSPSLPPLLELSLRDTDIPRTLAPLPWQVSGRKAEGLRYPTPHGLGNPVSDASSGNVLGLAVWGPSLPPEKPPPCSPAPSFSFSSHHIFPAASRPMGQGVKR